MINCTSGRADLESNIMYHAKLAASQSGRWLSCPGSVPFLEQLKADVGETTSEYAQEGIFAHECLNHQLEVMYKKATPDPKLLNHKDQWAIDIAIEYVMERMEFNPNSVLALEKFVTPILEYPDCAGTSDIILLTSKELEIIDYKHGKGVFVSPEWNTQLLVYALGALNITDINIDYVRTTIIQPRHGEARKQSPQGDGILSTVYEMEQIFDFKEQLEDGIEVVNKVTEKAAKPTYSLTKAYDEGYISPGPRRKACRFCDLKPLCPAIHEGVNDAVATFAEFEDLDVSAVEDSPVLTLDAQKKLLELYEQLPTLKQLVDDTEYLIHTLLDLEEPPAVLDHKLKLVTKVGHRKWVKKTEEIVSKMLELGVPKSKCYDVALKSPSKMEKLLPSSTQLALKAYYGKPITGKKVVYREEE